MASAEARHAMSVERSAVKPKSTECDSIDDLYTVNSRQQQNEKEKSCKKGSKKRKKKVKRSCKAHPKAPVPCVTNGRFLEGDGWICHEALSHIEGTHEEKTMPTTKHLSSRISMRDLK